MLTSTANRNRCSDGAISYATNTRARPPFSVSSTLFLEYMYYYWIDTFIQYTEMLSLPQTRYTRYIHTRARSYVLMIEERETVILAHTGLYA